MAFQFLKVLWYYLEIKVHWENNVIRHLSGLFITLCINMHTSMCVCMYVSMYLCIYVCIDVCMCDYIYSINSIIQCYKQYYSAIPARNISELSLLLFKF